MNTSKFRKIQVAFALFAAAGIFSCSHKHPEDTAPPPDITPPQAATDEVPIAAPSADASDVPAPSAIQNTDPQAMASPNPDASLAPPVPETASADAALPAPEATAPMPENTQAPVHHRKHHHHVVSKTAPTEAESAPAVQETPVAMATPTETPYTPPPPPPPPSPVAIRPMIPPAPAFTPSQPQPMHMTPREPAETHQNEAQVDEPFYQKKPFIGTVAALLLVGLFSIYRGRKSRG